MVLLGDGEFDSVELQTFLAQAHWDYVCRTAKNTQVYLDGAWQARRAEIPIWPGSRLPTSRTCCSRSKLMAQCSLILWWERRYAEPIYLVTNLDLVAEACHWYRRRMRIETFFSDQKSRGFHPGQKPHQRSATHGPIADRRLLGLHLDDLLGCPYPRWKAGRRLSIALIAAITFCFNWAWTLLDYYLNEGLPVPVDFQLYQRPL